MELCEGQVSCQARTCLSSLTLYAELRARSCVGHMPHSPTPPPVGRQPQKKSHRGGRQEEGLFFPSGPHCVESLQISLSLSHTLCSLLQEAFFLRARIPMGFCNSKHLLGKMLVAAPLPHGLTAPIPPAFDSRSHVTSNILICGYGCMSNKKPVLWICSLVCSCTQTNQKFVLHFLGKIIPKLYL